MTFDFAGSQYVATIVIFVVRVPFYLEKSILMLR